MRFDPFAMLPFMGYNVGDYIQHWLDIGKKIDPKYLPKIYWVNWFAKDEQGKFMWPGFGDNSRVLKWVVERCENTAAAVETPLGFVPTESALYTEGLNLKREHLNRLLTVNADAWLRDEMALIRGHFQFIGERLPAAMKSELAQLEARLAQKAKAKL